MIKKVLQKAALGFVVGMFVGLAFAVVAGISSGRGMLSFSQPLLSWTGSELGALVAQMLLSGLYGAIPMAGTVFYEMDSWSMLKQAVVHYVTYTAAFIPIAFLAGWIELSAPDIVFTCCLFAVAHMVIWLVMYRRYKAEVNELNELLETRGQSNESEN